MKFFSLFPPVSGKSTGIKLLIIALLAGIFFVISSLLGILLAIPIFGMEILTGLGSLQDLSNPETLAFMKYFQVVNQVGIFILPALFYAGLESGKISDYLLLNKKVKVKLLIISILIIAVSIPAINWLVEANEAMRLPQSLNWLENWMRETEENAKVITEAFLNVNTLSGYLINMLIIALLAALGEEFLFRGVILRIFYDGTKSIHLSVLLSAIMFSFFHFQFYGFFPRLYLGILFGYIFVRTGTIWTTVILHFLFNGMTVTAYYLSNRGIIETDVDTMGSSSSLIIIFLSFLSAMLLLKYLGRVAGSNK